MPEFRALLSPSLTLLLALAVGSAAAQTADKLSDAERARRDAEKVFSFIKFHTVKPAAPKPAPVASAKPAPRPAAAPVATPVVAAAATAATSQPAPAPAPAPAPSSTVARSASAPASATEPPAAAATLPPPAADSAPAVATTLPPVSEPAPAPVAEPVVVEEEEVPLKLIAYVPPEMNAQVLNAMEGRQIAVAVRFVVQPDGRVSEARSTGSAPRRVANAAVRAVQQWRFDPIPAVREIDVELVFKPGEE